MTTPERKRIRILGWKTAKTSPGAAFGMEVKACRQSRR